MQTDKNEPSFDVLNKTAQEILQFGSSSSDGILEIITISSEKSISLQCKIRKVIDIPSVQKQNEYQAAGMQLMDGGYITKKDPLKGLFQITEKGFDYADRLRKEETPN